MATLTSHELPDTGRGHERLWNFRPNDARRQQGGEDPEAAEEFDANEAFHNLFTDDSVQTQEVQRGQQRLRDAEPLPADVIAARVDAARKAKEEEAAAAEEAARKAQAEEARRAQAEAARKAQAEVARTARAEEEAGSVTRIGEAERRSRRRRTVRSIAEILGAYPEAQNPTPRSSEEDDSSSSSEEDEPLNSGADGTMESSKIVAAGQATPPPKADGETPPPEADGESSPPEAPETPYPVRDIPDVPEADIIKLGEKLAKYADDRNSTPLVIVGKLSREKALRNVLAKFMTRIPLPPLVVERGRSEQEAEHLAEIRHDEVALDAWRNPRAWIARLVLMNDDDAPDDEEKDAVFRARVWKETVRNLIITNDTPPLPVISVPHEMYYSDLRRVKQEACRVTEEPRDNLQRWREVVVPPTTGPVEETKVRRNVYEYLEGKEPATPPNPVKRRPGPYLEGGWGAAVDPASILPLPKPDEDDNLDGVMDAAEKMLRHCFSDVTNEVTGGAPAGASAEALAGAKFLSGGIGYWDRTFSEWFVRRWLKNATGNVEDDALEAFLEEFVGKHADVAAGVMREAMKDSTEQSGGNVLSSLKQSISYLSGKPAPVSPATVAAKFSGSFESEVFTKFLDYAKAANMIPENSGIRNSEDIQKYFRENRGTLAATAAKRAPTLNPVKMWRNKRVQMNQKAVSKQVDQLCSRITKDSVVPFTGDRDHLDAEHQEFFEDLDKLYEALKASEKDASAVAALLSAIRTDGTEKLREVYDSVKEKSLLLRDLDKTKLMKGLDDYLYPALASRTRRFHQNTQKLLAAGRVGRVQDWEGAVKESNRLASVESILTTLLPLEDEMIARTAREDTRWVEVATGLMDDLENMKLPFDMASPDDTRRWFEGLVETRSKATLLPGAWLLNVGEETFRTISSGDSIEMRGGGAEKVHLAVVVLAALTGLLQMVLPAVRTRVPASRARWAQLALALSWSVLAAAFVWTTVGEGPGHLMQIALFAVGTAAAWATFVAADEAAKSGDDGKLTELDLPDMDSVQRAGKAYETIAVLCAAAIVVPVVSGRLVGRLAFWVLAAMLLAISLWSLAALWSGRSGIRSEWSR